jgi:hypothetical protein
MDISSLKQQFDAELAAAASEADLRALRDRYLARKGGLLSTLLKDVASTSVLPSAATPTSSNNTSTPR